MKRSGEMNALLLSEARLIGMRRHYNSGTADMLL